MKVEKLIEGNQYFFKILAINDVGIGEPWMNSEPITAKSPFDPPSPERNLTANDVKKSDAPITWLEPETDGGSPITGYYVERYSGSRWLKINRKSVTSLELKMDDLV